MIYKLFIKRPGDILASLIGLIIALPFSLVLIPVISLSNSGPVFFTRKRPGLYGKLFRLIKFRTMNDKCGSDGRLLPDGNRLTPIGRIIRSLSIDELPQLMNVLKGDMSIIGPRPLLEDYLPLYNSIQKRRHEVRPGITGWAQVNGRNSISWEEKFELDVWYVDNISFMLDMKIIFLTFKNILKRKGINSANAATMERFLGSREEVVSCK